MTVDELRGYVNTAVSLGDLLKVFLPGEWDDRLVDYLRAFAASDALLSLLADDLTPDKLQLSSGERLVLRQADGTEKVLDPATIAIFIQLATFILDFIRKRREGRQ